MWNACAKRHRLDNALRLRGIDPESFSLDQLDRVLLKRGITDAQLNPIIATLISVLEPPGCEMTHCKLYGTTTSPMNCADGRVPGRCPILRAYRQRRDARIAKDWRNVLNDYKRSIAYDDMPPAKALEQAAHAADVLKRDCHTAAARKRYDIALDGARAELAKEQPDG